MAPAFPRLYAIVDADTCARVGRSPRALAAEWLAAGVRLLQVRGKGLGGADLLSLVEAIAALARRHDAAVIVNDRVDVAAAAGVGVHVGQDDLPVTAVRRLLGPGAVVGCSTHTLAQLDAAVATPVSYLAFGPVFPTATKANPDPVVGLDGVRAAARRAAAAALPLVAIGGITVATAPAVIAAGADAVAVIGDLLTGDEPPGARARRFLVALGAPPV